MEVTAKSIETGADINVNDPKDKVYDGEVHQWEPTVKDSEKTLVKDTDYTVTYDTTDFTNVTGEITVTNTGKGNYTGTCLLYTSSAVFEQLQKAAVHGNHIFFCKYRLLFPADHISYPESCYLCRTVFVRCKKRLYIQRKACFP